MLTRATQAPGPPVWPEPFPTLQVRHVPGKGRGVFALVRFQPGETIELASVLLAPGSRRAAFMGTVLKDYTFRWNEDNGEIAFCLGLGSLYNHSFSPNARYIKSLREKAIRFLALTDISPGDEITVNYNGSPSDASPVWFEPLP
ncbi:MAG: SET domain-containing protein-lysine N-methyltransferase [Dehalococcoidia bacterium]|nr:SET domain-containing protein-lysine N-methyltransferase [Dehalococcoidia bacterium]